MRAHGANAALVAVRGFVGEARVLETRRGFFEAFGGVNGTAAGEVATRDLGSSWDIVTDMAIKLVPGGIRIMRSPKPPATPRGRAVSPRSRSLKSPSIGPA